MVQEFPAMQDFPQDFSLHLCLVWDPMKWLNIMPTTWSEFWKLQVTIMMNMICDHGIPEWFVDWFCGGVQYQVDHHLCLTRPKNINCQVPQACRILLQGVGCAA